MEMQQIKYFLTLSRTLNFTRAAEECNVSQPALTRAIQLLESELGGELLRRERQNPHLTELGHRLLPYMTQCYESALSAKAFARSIKSNEIAPLSFAVSQSVDGSVLAAPLGELSRACAGVQLTLRRGSAAQIVELLKDGTAELAVAGPLGDAWERLDRWDLFTEPYVLMVNAGHRLAQCSDADVDQLTGERLLVQVDCEMAGELEDRLSANGVSPQSTHQVELTQDMLALVRANLGVAIVPASLAPGEGVRRLPLKRLNLDRTVTIYAVAGRRRTPVSATLLNLLRSANWPAPVL